MERINSIEDYHREYKRSVDDPENFWAEKAGSFHWRKKWDSVLEWNFKDPDVKWFINGKLNITENGGAGREGERGSGGIDISSRLLREPSGILLL